MKKYKKYIFITAISLSAFLICFLLLHCLTKISRASSGQRKFGATYMTMNNPFFRIMDNSIEEVVESNGDILITRDPAQDQAKQNSQIEEMIEDGVSAIFLNPVDWKGVKPALIACKKAGIPVFNIDTFVYDKEYVVSTIASDNYMAGVQCASDMIEKLDKADIVILNCNKMKSISERVQGFKDTISGHDNYRIVYETTGEGELEVSMNVMNDIIKTGLVFNVVMGGNDPTALGALAALQKNRKDEGVTIYGVDGSPDVKKMVKDGLIEGTSAQSPIQIGTRAAEMAYEYLKGKKVQKNMIIPVNLITKKNLDEYDIDGWQ